MSTASSSGGSPPSKPNVRRRRRFWQSISRRIARIAHHVFPDLGRRRSWLGRKSIWDWLDLLSKLAIPVVVAIVTLLFAAHQTDLANLQHKRDQQSANLQHRRDQQSATDQQRAAIMQTYIDSMQRLLLNPNWINSKPGNEIRQLARVQTLTTLRRLDARRNGIVLQFLRDAQLIGVQNTAIDLSHADMSNDLFSGVNLSGLDLIGTNLTGAHLDHAILNDATLYGAYLNKAKLSDATLYNANLDAADLTGAILTNAHLSDATFTGASLGDAMLHGATLTDAHLDGSHLNDATLTGALLGGASLNGAVLQGANLAHADLSGANLSGADLRGADLIGADLNDADISGTPPPPAKSLTQPQLDRVYSCTNATVSAGLKCPHKTKITLTYWYTESGPEAHVIHTLITQFQRQYPSIRIKAVNESYFQAQAAFISASQHDKAPDIFRSDVGWVAQFASQHYLLNIDSHISQRDLTDYRKDPLGRASLVYDEYNGHLYGVPQVADFLALMYNKADITSPPATMDEFKTDAMNVVQKGKAQYGFETTGTSYYALPFLYAFGGGMLDQHNKILVRNAGSVAGLNFLLSLQETPKVMPANVDFSNGAGKMVNDFMTGKTAMIFDGPWDVLRIRAGSSFKHKPTNLGIAGIPSHDGQTGSPLGGQAYVMSADTAHPVEAYKFISFMSAARRQDTIAENNHTLPTRRSAYRDREFYSDPVISEFLRFKGTARPRPAIPQGGNLFYAFDSGIRAVLQDGQDPKYALNEVADAWQQLLADSPSNSPYPYP